MASFLTAWRSLDDARHRAELYRMWGMGVAAGFTTERALDLAGARPDPSVEAARRALLDGARRGASLGDLARTAPGLSHFESALLVLGDESGRLEHALALLGTYHERKHRWMLVVRKRLAYPLFTMLLATVIAPFPLLWFGHARAYVVIVACGLALWLAAGGAIVQAASERYGRTPALVRARLLRGLVTAIEAGLPLGRALSLAANATGDPAVGRHVRALGERRAGSEPLGTSLRGCPHLTPELLAAVDNAERTGDFAGALGRLADQYEDGFR